MKPCVKARDPTITYCGEESCTPTGDVGPQTERRVRESEITGFGWFTAKRAPRGRRLDAGGRDPWAIQASQDHARVRRRARALDLPHPRGVCALRTADGGCSAPQARLRAQGRGGVGAGQDHGPSLLRHRHSNRRPDGQGLRRPPPQPFGGDGPQGKNGFDRGDQEQPRPVQAPRDRHREGHGLRARLCQPQSRGVYGHPHTRHEDRHRPRGCRAEGPDHQCPLLQH
mmetsp:Transcript_29942/g.75344  ORF Transcript_29942/g.75344 Transcript_29942/m.75344 type:complete len:227 (-) Transcript_29942:493-1173(-)